MARITLQWDYWSPTINASLQPGNRYNLGGHIKRLVLSEWELRHEAAQGFSVGLTYPRMAPLCIPFYFLWPLFKSGVITGEQASLELGWGWGLVLGGVNIGREWKRPVAGQSSQFLSYSYLNQHLEQGTHAHLLRPTQERVTQTAALEIKSLVA